MKKILLLLLMMSLCLPSPAQRQKAKAKAKTTATQKTQKKTQQKQLTERQRLEAQKKQVKEKQAAARKRQRELEGRVKTGLENVQILDGEIENKRLVIDSIKQDITLLDSSITLLGQELEVLKQELQDRKDRYMKSVRYMYRNRKTQNKMMFVFSAKNFNQMYRRLRYSNDYATFQKAQGEAVKLKSEQVEQKKHELDSVRGQQRSLLSRQQSEQHQMEQKQTQQKVLVDQLKKEQKTVQQLIAKQQQEEKELNAKIERAIQAEIARAEAEARRKAEAERRRQEALAKKNQQKGGSQKATAEKSPKKTTTTRENFELPAADRALTGSFESNKGRLPIPITGSYSLIRGLGLYAVAGIRGVTLESKGLYYKGKPGAQVRCVFDGQVTAIVERGNSYVVMVRHGRYISVYCNVTGLRVANKQMVKTNQILGNVGENNILQFQLRNWTQILNPKPWLSR